MKLNDRNIFLLDGIGALLTAVTIGVVLPFFSDWIGLPAWILQSMGLLASAFAAYSLSCYWLIKHTKPLMLLGIISANSTYSILALALALQYEGLTWLGRTYFIGEACIILGIVFIETRIYRKSFG